MRTENLSKSADYISVCKVIIYDIANCFQASIDKKKEKLSFVQIKRIKLIQMNTRINDNLINLNLAQA